MKIINNKYITFDKVWDEIKYIDERLDLYRETSYLIREIGGWLEKNNDNKWVISIEYVSETRKFTQQQLNELYLKLLKLKANKKL